MENTQINAAKCATMWLNQGLITQITQYRNKRSCSSIVLLDYFFIIYIIFFFKELEFILRLMNVLQAWWNWYKHVVHLVIDCENDEDEEDEEAEVVYKERTPLQRQNEVYRGSQSRFASTSSGSSVTSAGGAETPVIQSDDEEVHADTVLLTSVPCSRDEETEEEDEEEKCVSKTHQNNWPVFFPLCFWILFLWAETPSMVGSNVISFVFWNVHFSLKSTEWPPFCFYKCCVTSMDSLWTVCF